MSKYKVNDCCHRAFFMWWELRRRRGRILIRCLISRTTALCRLEWMAAGIKICCFAFNLWNNYVEDGREKHFIPGDLLCCEFCSVFYWRNKNQIPGILYGFSSVVKRGKPIFCMGNRFLILTIIRRAIYTANVIKFLNFTMNQNVGGIYCYAIKSF